MILPFLVPRNCRFGPVWNPSQSGGGEERGSQSICFRLAHMGMSSVPPDFTHRADSPILQPEVIAIRRKLVALLVVLGVLPVMAVQYSLDPDLAGPDPTPDPAISEILFLDRFDEEADPSCRAESIAQGQGGIRPLSDFENEPDAASEEGQTHVDA